MSNFLTATVTIEGIRPLLWNAFPLDAIPLTKRERTGVAGNDPQEWQRTVLVTPDRQLYVEPTYIFAAIRDGARYTLKGRSSLQPLVVATLQVLDEKILLNRFLPEEEHLTTDPTAPIYLDVRGVKNPNSRGRNIRYRIAASPGWEMTFHLLWDASLVSRDQLLAVIMDAGQLSGLADGRKIGFGRFVVKAFRVEVYRA